MKAKINFVNHIFSQDFWIEQKYNYEIHLFFGFLDPLVDYVN